jgi:hypothetical protein
VAKRKKSERPIVAQLVNKFSTFIMEPEGSFLCSQPPATGPYPQPDEASPHLHSSSFKRPLVLPTTPISPKWSHPFRLPNYILYVRTLVISSPISSSCIRSSQKMTTSTNYEDPFVLFFPASSFPYYLIFPTSIYSSQHSALKHIPLS